MIDYGVYLVTDDPSRYAGNWLDNVVAAVEGGVTCVQYRDTENTVREQHGRILALRDALRRFGTPIIVNNDAELAVAVKAEGVHVGQHDLPVAEVRRIVGRDCEIGLSITDISQLTADGVGIADCLGIGPVFDARKTKADASAAMGVAGLRAVVEAVARRARAAAETGGGAAVCGTVGTVAIGGITLANAAEVLATGVGGVAVVSAFSKSENPYEVARNLSLLSHHRRI